MKKLHANFLRVSSAALMLLLSAGQLNAQCVSQPTAGATGSCPNTLPTLVASGLAPGGQGSNSSGVLTLNGSNQYLASTNPVSLSGATALTMEYWFKGSSCTSAIRIQPGGYIVAGWSNPPIHILSDDQGTGNGIRVDASGTSVIYNGSWHHVAMTWQAGGSFTSYLDGVQQVTRAATGSQLTINGTILIGSFNGGELTNGSMDNVRIWTVCRSQAQIQADMFLETPSVTTGLLVHYKMNGNYTCATSSSYNANGVNAPGFAAPNYYTYTWSGSNAPTASTSEVQTATSSVTLPQNYTLTATSPVACQSSGAVLHLGAVCAQATPSAACSGSLISLSAPGYTGTIQWQSSSGNSPYNWVDISGGTTSPYSYAFGGSTTYFQAVINDGGNYDTTNTVTVQALNGTVLLPSPVATSTGQCSGNATLIATGLVPGGQGSNSSGVLGVSSGAYLNVTKNSSLTMPGDFTYEMWVKPTSYTSNNTYFENGTWSGQTLLFRQDGSNSIGLYASGTALGSITYAPPLNVWTHLALVRSGSAITLYANGSAVGSFSSYGTAINPVTDLRIGSSQHATGQYWIGYIDEFRYWKGVALSASTINTNRFSEVSPSHPNYSSLSCEFKFNGDYTDAKGSCTSSSIGGTSFAAANYYTYTWSGTSAPAASGNEVQTLTGAITPPQDYSLVASVSGTCSSNPVTVHVGTACAEAGQSAVCAGTSVILSVSGYTGTIQWQSSTSNILYDWQDISGGTTGHYAYIFGSSTTYFRAVITDDANTDISNTITVQPLNASVSLPQPLASGTRICSGNANLIASGMVPGGQGSNTSGVLSVSGGAYMNVTNNSSLSMPGDFTYEMWVKPTSFTSNNTYFSNGFWPTQTLLFRQDNPNSINLYASGSGLGNIAWAPPLNVWTHLALVRSGSTITLYANGNAVGNFSSYGTAITPATDLGIGASKHSGSEYFIGYIDEFRYWKGAVLSPATINSYRFSELTSSHPSWSSLSCEFKFNGNYTDAKGNCTGNGVGTSSFAAANFYTFKWSGVSAPAASGNEVQTLTSAITPPQAYILVASVAGACPSSPVSVNVYGDCASSSQSVACAGNNVTLYLYNYAGTIQWQSSATNTPYDWQDVSGGTTTPYDYEFGGSTTYLRAVITDGGNSDTSNVITIQAINSSIGIPLPTVNNSSMCTGNTPDLTITGLVPGGMGNNTSGVLSLNGSNQYVQTNLTSLAGTELTIEYWFKGSTCQSAVRQQCNGCGNYIIAGWQNNIPSQAPTHILSFDGGSGNGLNVDATGQTVIHNGQWHHVAMTWKANTTNGFCSYLDGVLQGQRNSANTSISNFNAVVEFGRYVGNIEYTNGNLDNIRIWSVARTQAQLQADMFLETPTNSTGLLAQYKFNGDFTCSNNPLYNGGGVNSPVFTAPNYYTYTWTGTNAPSASGNEVQTISAAITAPQTYTMIASAPNFCPSPTATTYIGGSCASADQATGCSGGTVNLSLSQYTGTIQWQSSASNTLGDWQDISGATSTPYAYTFGSSTTYFRAVVTNGANGDTSNVITVPAITVVIPTQPTVSNSGICSGTPVLTASGLVPGGQGSNTSGTMSTTGASFVNVAANAKLTMPGDFTYEMWAYPTSWTGNPTYFSNGVYTSGIILLQLNPTQILLNINGTDYLKNYAPPLNAWTHLAVVRSGAVTSLYANGNQVVIFTSSYSSAITPGNSLFIAGRPDNPGNVGFIGKMDEFRFWKGIALDATTIKSRMTRELTTAERSSSNLSCEFKFNGDYTDASGNCTASGISASFAPANYYTYTWSGINAPAASTNEVQTVTASVTAPLIYTLVASAPNGCPGASATTTVGATCASANLAIACPGNTINLTLTNSTGEIQWQSSSGNSPYNWQNITDATTTPYAYTFGTSTTYFRAFSAGNTDSSNVVTVSVNNQIIQQPIAGSSGSCGGPQPTLTASGLVPGGQGSNSSGVVSMSGSSYVNVTSNSKLQMTGDFTYEMWVKPTSFNNNPTYFSNGPYNNGMLFWQTSSTNMQLYINGNSWNLTYGPPLNVWTHLALERSGPTLSLYANGSLVGNFPAVYTAASFPTANLFIGGRPDVAPSNGYIGYIDEFRYWNGIALDSNTLKSRLGRELTAAERSSANLSCEFKFNGNYLDATGYLTATGTSTSFAAANYYTYTWSGSNAPAPSTNEVQITTAAITPPQTYTLVASVGSACPSPANTIRVGGACASADQASACPGDIVNLSLTNAVTTVQWQSSSSNSPYDWQDISEGTTTPFAYTFETSTTYIRAVVVNGGNPDTSNIISVVANSFRIIPPQPTARNAVNCAGGPTLTATGLVPGGQGSNTSGVVGMTGGSYVNVPANTKLQMPGDFTYEIWTYPTSFNNNPTYFSNGAQNNGLLLWQTSSSNIQLIINNSTYNLTYAPSATAWTHMALERSGSTISLYINGSPAGNFTTSFATAIIPSANLFIGGRPDQPGSNGFIGYIDEFRYWKGIAVDSTTLKSRIYRELTSAEQSSSNLSCEFKFNGNYLDAAGNLTGTGTSTSFAAANYYTYTWSGSNAPPASTNEVQTATGSITAPQLYTVRASLGTDCPGPADTTRVGACASVSVATVTCLNETTDLSLSAYTGTIQWQSSPDGIIFTDINGATTSPYTVPLGYPVNYFRAIITDGAITATSSTVVANVSISAANFNLGVSGSNSVTIGGTASLCIANPIPEYGSQPTGGTVNSLGGFRIHKFTTVGSDELIVPAGFNVNAEVLVVAGGGGGGTNMGGGGGGGGVIDNTSYALSPGTISLTVGSGGAGAPAGLANGQQPIVAGSNGGNSIFGSLTAIGGGRGGMTQNQYGLSPGASGGSGGGAGGYNDTPTQPAGYYTGGSGTFGQGYRGGNQGTSYYSGGGGGAGGAGANGNNQPNGGPGVLSAILGTAYYWGGGGGGSGYSAVGGNGGIGGGGGGAIGPNGSTANSGGSGLNNGSPGGIGSTGGQPNVPGGNAGANTGGGGGGGSHFDRTNQGGNGGSGIVVVRYPDITEGGAWSSSNTSIATVDPSTGTVTGAGTGTCNIIYTAGISGCTVQLAIIPFTVTDAPATICVGGAVPSGISANVNPPCTGGSVTTSGGYRIHVFTSNGTFTAPSNFNGNVEALVIAGGGGGGSFGGGGGAGGLIHNSSFTVTSGTYPVAIGAGGVGASTSDVTNGNGSNGSNSVFSSLIAIGGGGGGTRQGSGTNYAGSPGNAGGSGGGGSNSDFIAGAAGGAGTSGQGNAGGAGGSGTAGIPNYSHGGGGGAGGVGMTGKTNGTAGASGGLGLQLTQFAAFGGSPAGWFAGGGGGGIYTNGTDGIGGTGGGGNGGDNVNNIAAANGIANTGGGGGGARYQGLGGTGGSGIVIIKYPVSPVGAWMSSNTDVATVDSVGNVTGLALGTATITYTLTNGSCTSVQTSQVTVIDVAVGTASAADASVCTGNNTTLTLTGNSGTGIQWQQSADGTTGWAYVTGGSGETTTTYITPALISPTYYRVQTTGSCVSYSNVVLVGANPQPPAVTLAISGVTSLVVDGTSNLCAGSALPSGGTISSSGGYRIHKFTATGNDQFVVPAGFSTTAKVLVVAGGGGGGQTIGGGGGGGGVIYNSSFAITPQSYSVTVGAGGAGRPGNGNSNTYGSDGGAAGSNSVFASFTAIGGGGGGSYNQNSNGATAGGSGGGLGAFLASPAMAGTAGQGYAGGISQSCNVGQCIDGAGGGGAGGVGGNSSVGVSGAGGAGISNDISGTLTYYGGGGGGGARGVNIPNNQQDGGAGGAGGTGGGGAGGAGNVPGGISGAAGTVNSGGGGGGGGYLYNGAETTGSGGSGGSGIVIVSYPDVSVGGVWTSSNTDVATVNPTSGLVTGASPGTANIIYTVSIGGCIASSDTATVTVSAALPAICIGGTTTTGVTDPSNPTASGGNISSVNGYTIHTFNSGGTFTPPAGFNTTVDVLVVAGGGSGGGSNGSDIAGGGGGAGGLIYTSGYTVIPGSAITVTVGAGGTGNSGFVNGTNGSNSVFGSITTLGGGYGGTWTIAPTAGGSGGGAGENGQGLVAAAGTFGQGNAGGNGNSYINGAPNSAGGGGGGAGGAGASQTSNINGGNGGIGVSNSITGSSVYYAGGGGGAGGNTGGTGGQGGGGDGKGLLSGNGTAGAPNTGGGGGGALTNNNDGLRTAGNGGSGVVIVRYPQLIPGVWASSNTDVATVDTTGVVTGMGEGTTTISFTYTSSGCTSVQTALVTVSSASTGTISVSDPSICTGNNTTLTLNGNSGTGIQWQQSADGTTGWEDVTGGSGATSSVYTTPALTQLAYYRVQTSGQCSAYSSAVAVAVNPQPPAISFGITGATSLPVSGTSSLCASNYPTGGTVTVSGGYRIHKFSSLGTDKLIVPSGFSATAEVLVVAGGGGGGTNMGGGGGGGGVIYNSGYVLSSGDLPVYVGNGGAGAPAFTNSNGGSNALASSGENSIFGSLTAIGGGAGGTGVNDNPSGISPGVAGGSGGGASGYNNTNVALGTIKGGLGTAGQGNRGGNQGNQYYSGGGGGAGGAGADGNNQPNGGPGILNGILGTDYYWGGGGGGSGYTSLGGNGGIGGGGGGAIGVTSSIPNAGGIGLNNGSPGGNGSTGGQPNVPGGNAGANTGGGGGGGSHYNSNNYGGNGGSGIVVIRYPDVPVGTWHSSNTEVATVDASGVVTGVSEGDAEISYTVVTGGCTIVSEIVTVSVTSPTPSVCIGGKITPAITKSQATPPLTGGAPSTADGYSINTFTSNGTLVVPSGFNVPVEALIVAGGGGGGTNMGGGGGGGGVIDTNSYILSPGNISVTIGSGGAGAPAFTNGNGGSNTLASPGGNSVFGSITAIGGGAGGSGINDNPVGISPGGAGGSGGGASGYNNNNVAPGTIHGGAGTAGQGYRGGNQGSQFYSGGGGGAGGPGGDGNNKPNGGPGVANSILGTVYYWGGGGGGSGYTNEGGNGGAGGGGGGAVGHNGGTANPGGSGLNNGSPGGIGSMGGIPNVPGGNAGANTGGGGGGGSHYNSNNKGGNGGSGIVIVRYKKASVGTFTSSNTNIATVDSATGEVTGVANGNVIITYTLNDGTCTTIQTAPVTVYGPAAVAGTAISTCSNSGAINITAGSSAENYSSVAWTSSGTGGFSNENSLTSATYTPGAADIAAGSVTLTLTAYTIGSCSDAIDTKVLMITTAPAALAGTAVLTCSASGAVDITAGSSASDYNSVEWTSDGTGSFANANSLTTATYTPSAADITAGSVTLTLTANANGVCENVTDTKTLTIYGTPASIAGTAVATCSNSGAVNITAGSSASNYSSIAWTSSGTGSFANANSITTATYTPSAADITAGSVTLTLTAYTSGGCANATDTKTLTISTAATAVAGTAISTCSNSGAVNITGGSSASNYSSVTWTSSGTGNFINANSLTAATYNPSAVDLTPGTVILTLTANANGTCANAVDTKTLTVAMAPSAVAGNPVTTCSTSGAVNITSGSSASNYSSVTWTSGGTGSFNNANSLTTATYNPSAADKSAGSVILTLTANGNGACANAINTKTLTIDNCAFPYTVKCFIQGYYLGGGTMSPLLHLLGGTSSTDVDTVTIELHRATDPYDSLYSFREVLQSDGIVTGNFPPGASGSFYVVVKHRNSIDTWSASPQTINAGGNYDFTGGAGQARGGNMLNLGSGVYGIYSGDINHDGAINASDKTIMQGILSTFMIGVYNIHDISGDALVDEDDYRILQNNIPLDITVSHP